MDEQQLIARALAGDPTAERAIYDQHVDRIYRLAYRLAGDPDLAEEYTQDAFVRAFDRLSGFRGEAALSSWLHAIAVSVVINGLRKLKRRRRHEVTWEEVPASPDPRSREDVELTRLLTRAIDDLPDDLRVVFVMHETEGYKHREIAETLEIPEGTSKTRLMQAKKHLREAIREEAAVGLHKLEPRVES